MRIDRKRLVLGVALAGALSVLIAGCGRQEEQATQPATTSQAATTPETASTTQPAITTQPATTTVGTVVDDGVITTKVKAALLADADIKSLDIGVETNKGDVQLSGVVNSQDQIDQAVAIAKKVDGVANVGNQMSIKK